MTCKQCVFTVAPSTFRAIAWWVVGRLFSPLSRVHLTSPFGKCLWLSELVTFLIVVYSMGLQAICTSHLLGGMPAFKPDFSSPCTCKSASIVKWMGNWRNRQQQWELWQRLEVAWCYHLWNWLALCQICRRKFQQHRKDLQQVTTSRGQGTQSRDAFTCLGKKLCHD